MLFLSITALTASPDTISFIFEKMILKVNRAALEVTGITADMIEVRSPLFQLMNEFELILSLFDHGLTFSVGACYHWN